MGVIINIYKTVAYSDPYSKSGAMDDPIWPRSGFIWDGEDGQYRDIQLYARNDGDIPGLAVIVSVADISGTSEAHWGKVALTQPALAAAAPGGSVALGDIAVAGTVTFWLRVTVPINTDPEDKIDLRVRTSASVSSSSSSSSESSTSTSSSSTSVSSTSTSSRSESSSSQAPYLCDTWLLAVAHWPDNQIFIYEKVGGTNLLGMIPTPGEYPDAVAMYAGDIIVADSITRKIYIYSGTDSGAIRDSYNSAGGKVVTGFGILNNNLIHCELGDYPHGMIYVHEGVSSAIIDSFESPTHMPHALTVIAIGDLFSSDRWDHRIYKHSGATREIRSYYDAYALSLTPPIADGLGLAYDTCGNLLEYDSRTEKLYIHEAVAPPILATANYNIAFTDIACPVESSSSSSRSSSSSSNSSSSLSSSSSSSSSSSLSSMIPPHWIQVAPELAPIDRIYALCVYDNGGGDALYGTGRTGGRLYRWNDVNAWDEVAPFLNDSEIRSLVVYDNGGGNKLYCSTGSVGAGTGGKLYQWNDVNAWQQVAPKVGVNSTVYSLTVYDSGVGDHLYGAPNLKSLFEWNDVNAWVDVAAPMISSSVHLAVYNNELYKAGTRLYKWNNINAWVAVTIVASPSVGRLAVYDNGGGNKLYGQREGKLYEFDDVDQWVEVAPVLGAENSGSSLYVFNNKLYTGTSPNGKLYEWNDSNAWVEVAARILGQLEIYSLIEYGGELFGGTYPDGNLFKWVDTR